MYTLYIKEIRSFLSSLVGYITIAVFITLIGVFMWIIPTEGGGYNILDNGFANIDPLFYIAPWVYLFLIPAITMRSFSEEKKNKEQDINLLFLFPNFPINSSKYELVNI
jgi:ABC-2 type transport system permease protein